MLIYRFRNCLLNTVERSVIKGDHYVDLTPKTFDVLLYLIENAGKAVAKDELLGAVWGGNFVEESNLPVHISKLRRCLGEARGRRYIETIQGVGYRFTASVQKIGQSEWRVSAAKVKELESDGLFGLPVSIAVLPLVAETSGSSIDYLADGLTDGLINTLSSFESINAIARETVFRFKKQQVDPVETCKLLGVSSVLVGQVELQEEALRVGVRLIGSDGVQQWGTVKETRIQDLFETQQDIALDIAKRLSRTVTQERPLKTLASDSESYRLFLKGRYLLERHRVDDIKKAIQLFEEAVAMDSENVHANVEIVECHRLLYKYDHTTYQEFLQSIEPVLQRFTASHDSIAAVQLMYSDVEMEAWSFDDAIEHCKKALALNPALVKARVRYSDLLMQSHRYSEALRQLEELVIIDPLSSLLHKRIGRLLYVQRKYGPAMKYLNEALEFVPNDYEALALRGAVYVETGDFHAALYDLTASLDSEFGIETLAITGVVYAKMGRQAKARSVLRQLGDKACKPQHALALSHVALALGEKEDVYHFLEYAVDHHVADLRTLNYDPRFAGLRKEARFKNLLRRVGLQVFDD